MDGRPLGLALSRGGSRRPGGRGRPGWVGAAAGAGRGGGGLPGGPQQPGDNVVVNAVTLVAVPRGGGRGGARDGQSRGGWCEPPGRGEGPGGQPVVVDVRC